MADSRSYTKPHLSPQEFEANHSPVTRHKSYTHIFCKSLFFLLFLIAIPLFPSQAPNFISQSIFTKFWELVHLLFIGVAVSYGLFSRRNVEVDFETHSNNYDDAQSSFVSRIFHVSPIFEDGYENPCGFDEKNLYQSWNSQFYRGESTVTVTNGSSVIGGESKTGSINFENETEVSHEQDQDSVVQTWNSQYFQGESVIVLSQPNYAIGEWEKPGQVIGYKPLGLPVRSLKSKIRNPGSAQFSNGSESSSSLIGSPSSSGRSMDEERMGDMGPSNLEEKFTESFSSPSQVPWRSRSGRGDMWEKVGPVTGRPSHFRPLSVDETQFESLKSQSFRSATSFSSQASSMSNSPTRLSPSDSVPSDSPNSGTEESGKKKDFRASYPPASQSPLTTVNREARLNAFHLRRYSSGSLFQKDLRGTSKDKLKDLSGRKEDSLASKERGQGALKLDRKLATATVAKPTSKGKSVRTIRSGVYTPESIKFGEMIKTHIDDKAGEGSDVAKAVNTGKNEMKREGMDNMSGGINKKNLDTHYDVPMPTYAKYLKKEKEEGLGNVAVESETDLESKTDSTPASSDEGSVTDFVSDAGGDPNEVDKKAGEFIAKFREQIRLQKVASIEKSKVKRMSGKHLR